MKRIVAIVFAALLLMACEPTDSSLRGKCESRYESNKYSVSMSKSRYVSNCLQTYEDMRDGSLID